MKIRYKLIILFVIIIMAAAVPLSLYILNKQEESKISIITRQGERQSTVLARSIRNIILSNGLNVYATRVDAKEMISILKPLAKDGLIYADAVLLSSRKSFNGVVLVHYSNRDIVKEPLFNAEKLSTDDVTYLKNHKGFQEITVPGIDDVCYEFVAFGALPKIPKLCTGRLIFSRSAVLKPIHDLRLRMIGATVIAITVVSFLGLLFSRVISKPIAELTTGVERIGEGDFNHKVPVTTHDELGTLASTFNQLTEILANKIAELEETNKELQRLDELKDEFLANVSHEIRSPLQGIIGLVESIVGGAAASLDTKTMNNLHLIMSNTRRLASLVNDILDLSRLKNFDILLQKTSVDIHAVASLVLSLLQPVIDQKALTVRNRIKPKTVYVDGDPDRLQQILMNLINNAIKFTEKGTITVSVKRKSVNGKVVVAVADTGRGIPVDKKDVIFEAFEQGEESITRSYGGTGLGLTIAKNLVELHGGTMWVESEPNKGSCFYFSLPRAPKRMEEDTRVIEKQVPVPDQKIMKDVPDDLLVQRIIRSVVAEKDASRVMVVEDETINLQILVDHLALAGYAVEIATDGHQALEMIHENDPPDLILLDIMLPGMSGYEVCGIIRERYSQYELPIIMLTARSKPGLEVGANDYIVKPVEKRELLARVRNFIALKKSIEVHSELNILKHELSIADEIHRSLLPSAAPPMDNVSVAVRYTPVSKIGGDFYDFIKLDDKRLGILLSDVSGHGIPAAFVASMFEVSYTFTKGFAADPATFFNKINEAMSQYSHGQYLTASYVFLDFNTKKLLHANAGHLPLLIIRREYDLIINCKPKGRPIGVFPDSEYFNEELDIMDGDRLLFLTDGLIEIRNSAGEFYGMEGVKNFIHRNQDRTAEDFVDLLIADVEKWSAKKKRDEIFIDDVTAIIVDINFAESKGNRSKEHSQ
jgi:two-component system sensor histidine kinase ChiS